MNKFLLLAAIVALLAVFTNAYYQSKFDRLIAILEEDEYELQYNASAAMTFAKSQVGHAYVMGGTGPSWDCSGLMQAAFAKGGVSLPRTSGDQCSRGTAVPTSQMAPGDLLCFPGHVAMYLGNNQIVHAANSKRGVVYDPVYATPSSVRRF